MEEARTHHQIDVLRVSADYLLGRKDEDPELEPTGVALVGA